MATTPTVAAVEGDAHDGASLGGTTTEPPPPRLIYLFGGPGCGKNHVGRVLARVGPTGVIFHIIKHTRTVIAACHPFISCGPRSNPYHRLIIKFLKCFYLSFIYRLGYTWQDNSSPAAPTAFCFHIFPPPILSWYHQPLELPNSPADPNRRHNHSYIFTDFAVLQGQ